MTKVIDFSGLTYYTGKIKVITNGLQSQINDLKARGRFLSVWLSSQGKPQTEPGGLQPGDVYNYAAGDYYLISSIADSGGTNYRPDGNTYIVGSISTTIETEEVNESDVYYFDGTQWILWINSQRTITFASIAGQPTDNTNLASALNDKVTKNNNITAGTKCKITYDSKGLVTSGADLSASDIPNITLSKISDVTATVTEVNVLDGITATTTELNYVDGVTSNIQTQLNAKATDTAVVHLAGAETVSGTKTFTGNPVFQANSYNEMLSLKRNTNGSSAIKFANSNGTMGCIGICSDNNGPGFWNTSNTVVNILRNSTFNTAVGSTTQPVYIDANGVAAACTYSLNKTVPSDAVFTDTNTKVTQTVSTTNAEYPILAKDSNATTTTTATSIFAAAIKINPSTGNVTATKFTGALVGNVTGNCSGSSGSCTGNAATATKLGISTVGNTTQPIYLNAGTATTCNTMCDLASAQTISGVKTFTGNPVFSSDNYGQQLTINRTNNTTGYSVIRYSNGGTIKGYLGTDYDGLPISGNAAGTFVNVIRNSTLNTAVGSATQPVYTNTSGVVTACNTMCDLGSTQTISGAKTISSTLTLTKTTDASGTEDNKPALIVGGTSAQAHIEIDNNEVMAKSSATTTADLHLNHENNDVVINEANTANTVRLGNHRIQLAGVATMNYNSTTQALDFNFS